MSCPHLEEFKSNHGLESYEIIHSSIIIPNKSGAENPEALVSCFDCESYNIRCRLFACLHCVYFGCHEMHIRVHFLTKNHYLTVELSNGHILCYLCEDVVYDSDVDEIVKKNLEDAPEAIYVPWKPSYTECRLLKEHSRRIKVQNHSSVGMRGLMNLGNSCYMNCIVQALLHTPMLRDYFFSEKHKCFTPDPKECLFCNFAVAFQRYYSNDDPATLSLHEILYLIWRHDSNLSCYGQKDAHEFFISARNLLHQFSSPPNAVSEGPCDCIVDSIFHGTLQSDLVCLACSNVSTTFDPMWEISLNIPETAHSATLIDCLHHFTMPEPLGADTNCTVCNSYQECTKQLTIKLLPLVVVLHLKRFEQQVKVRVQRKKKFNVAFPLELDMTPYLTSQRNKFVDPCEMEESSGCDNNYSLYAVISHSGTLVAGHYISYIRRTANRWFKCNDMSVEPVTVEEVLKCEGYLLFYHKTVLPYE